MMGRRKGEQGQLFYAFDLEAVVPDDHQVRRITAVLDLSWVRVELAPHYSHTGRPSVDPELMIRMLILGYVFAIRSERALCREVQLNLAYRWFCGLGIEDKIPDHSAFTRARNERFRDHDVFRSVFERIVASCITAGLVGGNGFAVDASLIAADANKCRSTPGDKWSHDIDPETARRAVQDYLARLDDPADNYLIDVKFGIIMDVEASRAIRQAEVGAAQTMINRTEATFGMHVPVIDKSKRDDGTFSREDFDYDDRHDCYVCPNGKVLPRSSRKRMPRGDDMISYFSRVADCRSCLLKSKCCPKTPCRKITRHIHEAARDVARAVAKTAAYEQTRRDRKKVEMLFAHLKRILRMGRLRLRGPAGAQFEFTLAAIAQNLRRLARLTFHPPDTTAPCVA